MIGIDTGTGIGTETGDEIDTVLAIGILMFAVIFILDSVSRGKDEDEDDVIDSIKVVEETEEVEAIVAEERGA